MAETVKYSNGELRTERDEQVSVAALAGDLIEIPAEPTEIDAVPTTAATNSSPYGYSEAQANAIVTQLNNVIAILTAAGLGVAPE